MMHEIRRFSGFLVLSLFFLTGCKQVTPQPAPVKTIAGQQGGTITYGGVAGATSQAAGLTSVLKQVHSACGEQPKIGQVFQYKGTQMVGVFFTVVDHAQGNAPKAGLALAALTGPNQVQAALVSDDASRFSSTVNPMLSQLFGVWNTGGTAATGASTGSATATAPAAGQSAPAAGLHTVTLPDRTASVGIPNGWNVDPMSGGGSIQVNGPNGERIGLDYSFNAWDPTVPNGIYQTIIKNHLQVLPHVIVYPYSADIAKSFADILQLMRKSNGLASAPLQIASAQDLPASNGSKCAQATGQLNPDGKGMQALNMTICASTPQQGMFAYTIFQGLLPNSVAAQESATEVAIMNSFQVDMALVTQNVNRQMAPILAQLRTNWNNQENALISKSQQDVNQINQIGANATARMNATEAANSAEQASWNNQQNSNAQNAQGFSNYLLDQSVVQNNNSGAHSTQWNTTANALVQANPNKYQIVDTPGYIKNTDY